MVATAFGRSLPAARLRAWRGVKRNSPAANTGPPGAQPDTTVGLYRVNADRPLNSALPQLVNNKSVAPEGVARTGGAWVSGNTLRRHNRPADHYQHDRISEPEQLENETRKPLNPVVAWGIVLLASVALWGGLGLAISSVVSALL